MTTDAVASRGRQVDGSFMASITFNRTKTVRLIGSPMSLPRFAARGPVHFLMFYVRRRWVSHLVVLLAVLAAVGCAIGAQYGVKNLVDALASGKPSDTRLWSAVALLLALVAGDNLLWRLAGWVSTHAFVAVGGDIRIDLFHHLSGHGTRYFADRFPGALAGRITTAATAAWTIQSSLTWTTIPPAAAVIASIAVLGLIDWQMTLVLVAIVGILAAIIARLAAGGHHLHARFAGRAAAVSGDLTDVVSNIGLVRAFGATLRERERLCEQNPARNVGTAPQPAFAGAGAAVPRHLGVRGDGGGAGMGGDAVAGRPHFHR